ncbi:MAG: hypothetical protein ACR2HM_08365 [Acidimicrobiales bacterium]
MSSQDDTKQSQPTQDERIDAVTERIDKARTQAAETGLFGHGDGDEYVESGATEEEDDQTIVPPG